MLFLADGTVRRLNAAAAALLGVEVSWAEGQPLIAVVRDHRIERAWWERRPAELIVRGRHLVVTPFREGLTLRDVSEARQAQSEAREMLAVVSHELRTPATTITSTLEALGYDDLVGEQRSRLLQRAVSEAERLTRLLGDLTVEVAPPRERRVLVGEAVERACRILEPKLEQHDVAIRREFENTHLWADPDKLLQVLLNLLENAVVHGPDHADVTVCVEVEGDWARVRVRDLGAPLSPERSSRMFERRARGPSVETGGLGLGLFVVRSIVEAWGGAVWAHPWSGEDGAEGNEFGVLAPRARSASARRAGRAR